MMSDQGVRLGWTFLAYDIEADDLLLDCRSEEAFTAATIRGAYSAALIRKAHGSGPNSLLKLSGFVKSVQKLAENKKNIIVFDEGMGMFSGKMAWVLKSAGLKNVQVYGRRFSDVESSDTAPGLEVITEQDLKSPINFRGIVPISHVQTQLTRVQLVDVRSPEEYDGILPRHVNPEPGSRCGRLPGSLNFDWRQIYDGDGYIRSKVEIGKELRLAGLIPERPTILYDYNGARSSVMAFLFQECNYRHVDVFLGSWMEWRKTRLPAQNSSVWNP
ncbi:MAG: thiosulfate sulfurtransferase [Leptonema sp. (in: Bacteria)]|nr:thiosulfate sulfurtransferase [Leptonema sp. (in: bacteria)]